MEIPGVETLGDKHREPGNTPKQGPQRYCRSAGEEWGMRSFIIMTYLHTKRTNLSSSRPDLRLCYRAQTLHWLYSSGCFHTWSYSDFSQQATELPARFQNRQTIESPVNFSEYLPLRTTLRKVLQTSTAGPLRPPQGPWQQDNCSSPHTGLRLVLLLQQQLERGTGGEPHLQRATTQSRKGRIAGKTV